MGFLINFVKTPVMEYEDFMKIRESGEIPDDLPLLLQSLLLDAAGDWDSAHRIAQDEFTKEGSLIHAYLHRKEGDLGNASYWYSLAGRKMPDVGLEEEWELISRELLKS